MCRTLPVVEKCCIYDPLGVLKLMSSNLSVNFITMHYCTALLKPVAVVPISGLVLQTPVIHVAEQFLSPISYNFGSPKYCLTIFCLAKSTVVGYQWQIVHVTLYFGWWLNIHKFNCSKGLLNSTKLSIQIFSQVFRNLCKKRAHRKYAISLAH